MFRAWRLLFLAVLIVTVPSTLPASVSPSDAAFQKGWDLFQEEKFPEARLAFDRIRPEKYELGDYVLYFTGLCRVEEGNRAEATETYAALSKAFPDSPLVPYLALELAYAAAVDNDLPAAKALHDAAHGKVSGNGHAAQQGYVAARLLEAEGPTPAAAESHLENFVARTAQEAGVLSMERLRKWRADGMWTRWGLPISFHGKYANALSRSSEHEEARGVYADALRMFPPSDDYYTVLLDYAEFLRKEGDTTGSKALLDGALPGAPPAFRHEVEFLRARVDWKAGRLKDARRTFLAIAEGETRPATAQRARYLAAWIAEEEGDLAAATEEFGKLRDASDETIRQEATFRHAFGFRRQNRNEEAVALFAAGEKTGFSAVEKARHAYWKARTLADLGRAADAGRELARLAGDPGAGPYALFAIRVSGKDPYAMLNAPSSGETRACAQEKDHLWRRIRKADWTKEDAGKIRRMEHLIRLGIREYAILEAERVDRAAVRKALGLADGGTAGLIRYLAGDLRGAIRETSGLPNDPSTVELVDMIQFPLAPDYVGDCDRKKSGVDPLVLHSIIRQESMFQKNALSSAGALGLMQLLPRTAAEVARKEKMRKPRRRDLLKPAVNVALGAAYLSRMIREYGGDYVRAVAAYNAGETAVSNWWRDANGDPAYFLETMTYRETRFYLRRVFFNVLQYYQIYRPKMFSRYFPSAPQEGPPAPDASASPPSGGTPAAPPDPATAPAGGRSGG